MAILQPGSSRWCASRRSARPVISPSYTPGRCGSPGIERQDGRLGECSGMSLEAELDSGSRADHTSVVRRGLLIAVVLAAVLLVSACGSSRRTAQATHLTLTQIHARAVREEVQHEARLRARALAQIQPTLLKCAAWRAELHSGRVPKAFRPGGSIVLVGGWKGLLRSRLRVCNQYLS